MKKFITFGSSVILVALLGFMVVPLGAEAIGHILPRNVGPEIRTQAVTYFLATPSASEVTLGTNGVIVATTINGVAAPDTSTLDMLPYPAKVDVVLVDGGSDSTLTCASVTLYGRNQYGTPISETINTISETASESTKVYEIVTRIVGATCAGANAANDVLRASASNEVGLPFKIDTEGAAIQVCLFDATATDTLCATAADFVGDLDDDSIELDGATGFPTIAQGDSVTIRVRPPAGL